MRYINMFKLQKACSVLIVAALAMINSPATFAEAQFYLLAKPGPVSSLTGTTRSPQTVYLRWDLVEGELPVDISLFRLYRDGAQVGEFPVSGSMTEGEIAQLYQGPHQQRRLLERVAALKEEAARDDDVSDFPVSQFASRIYERLNSDSDTFWAAFTATQDFNVAVARYRATYDYPGTGTFAYELKAVSTTGTERRVGYAEVHTSQPATVLQNKGFAQVLQSACDELDFRDHYTVALNWDGPQTGSQADELAHRLFVAGYDLYRSTSNLDASVTAAPVRNLANEAAAASADAQGNAQFAGLERVNDVLVLSQPDNTDTAEWLETREDLIKAGLQPGDKRAYYLVARDFSGQFGPTMAAIVTIPDMARPPAPWDIRVFLDEADQKAELNFPAINVTSYLQRAGDSREICLTDTVAEGVIEFVPEGENCATFPTTRVHTDIEEYLLYRFESFDAASKFKDSDGDGYADMAERLSGTQCSPASTEGPSLVAHIAPDADDLGRVRITDAEPADNKGDIYWYRLAAKSTGGNYSLLTEPVRVNFPDRDLPAAPEVGMSRPERQICDCAISYSGTDTPWQMSVSSSLDSSSIRASCQGSDLGLTEKQILSPSESTDACAVYNYACNDTFPTFTLDTSNGQRQCEVTPTGGNNFCYSGTMNIEPVYCDEPVPFNGGISATPVTIVIQPPADSCATLYQRIGGLSTRVGTSCGEVNPTLEYEHEQGEFCGYAVAQDGNNNISPVTAIPCMVVANDMAPAPVTPRLTDLLLGSSEATLHWYSPNQPQTVNEVELDRTAPAGLAPIRTSVSAQDGGDLQATLTLPPQASGTEEWCARVRSYGISTDISRPSMSDWSAPVCVTRSTTVPPEWLPWPVAEEIPQGDDLYPLSNQMAASPVRSPLSNGLHIPLTYVELPDNKECERSLSRSGFAQNYYQVDGDTWLHLECTEAAATKIKTDIDSGMDFIVFRQSRTSEGQVSELIQVSPLLQFAYWNPVMPDGTENTGKLWLNDPYIWVMADLDQAGGSEIFATVAFVDRAGLISGMEYRYQIVWFDDRHALREWRMSDWTAYNASTAASTGGAE